jgi:putative addiction module component (TIGR02574 family)
MATSEDIIRVAMTLSLEVRAELSERLLGSLAEDVSPEITNVQLVEVRRRIAEVESDDAELIPGDEVSAQVRQLLDARLADMKRYPDDQSPWPEVKERLEWLDDEVLEALERDAEIEADPSQAITLARLNSEIRNRRKQVRAADDRQ